MANYILTERKIVDVVKKLNSGKEATKFECKLFKIQDMQWLPYSNELQNKTAFLRFEIKGPGEKNLALVFQDQKKSSIVEIPFHAFMNF